MRYFLCDQSLSGLSGHCFSYAQSLAQVLRDRGEHVVIVGNRAVAPVLRAERIAGVFSLMCDQRDVQMIAGADADLDHEDIRRAHEATMIADLGRLDCAYGLSAADVLVFNTIHHWPLRGIVTWLETQHRSRCPSVRIVLRFTASPSRHKPTIATRMYREALQRISESPCRERIRLFVDTEQLGREYRELTDLELELVPIPHSDIPSRVEPRGGPIRLAYIGEARFHKGFHLLPFLVRALGEGDHAAAVEFHIQAFSPDVDAQFFRMSLCQLEAARNVVLYRSALSQSQYNELLSSVDMVVLPYSTEYYHAQSSGTFSDAVGAGVPVVTSQGTWMAEAVSTFRNGETFVFGQLPGFVKAVRRVLDDIEAYRDRARHARTAWLGFHRPAVLASIVQGSR